MHHSDRKETDDYEGNKIENSEGKKKYSIPATYSLNRPQSLSTDLQIKFVIYLMHLALDKPPSQYDVPALKNHALNCIRGDLAQCDIVEESFSKFASQ